MNNAQKETKDITIFFNDEDDKEINKFNLSAVPFQRNYRTNIYGALSLQPLTTQSKSYRVSMMCPHGRI